MNIVDTSRNIIVSVTRKECISNAHIQLLPGINFLELPRGDIDGIYLDSYSDITTEIYGIGLTLDPLESTRRSISRILRDDLIAQDMG
jgi:hypothetical protein